jgi:hypothetical protein
MKKLRDQFYLMIFHSVIKGGVTGNSYNRFGSSSYNAGGFDNEAQILYWALPGYEEHINVLEKYYKRFFFEYLKKSEKDPNKVLEFFEEWHEHITIKYVQDILEDKIKTDFLQIKILKEIYLPSIRNDKTFVEKVRANPGKYLEDIA